MSEREVVYHVGLLWRDRRRDPHLNELAEHYLVLATAEGKPVRPGSQVYGEGKGRLLQRRLSRDRYEYVYVARS